MSEKLTVLFLPESAYGPTNQCVGIGDVLRHRSPMTTTIYAQHDTEALRGLAHPWPVEGDVR